MKKYLMSAVLLISLGLFMGSCSDDEPTGESVFQVVPTTQSDFDKWLYANYTKPYNIKFLYRYNDKETDNTYNVIPADPDKAKALAIMIKHMWIDAYKAVAGEEFIRQYGPKTYQLLGSPEYNTNGSIVLGYAESGVKITLFRVNEIDVDNPFVNLTDPFRAHNAVPLDLNYWYFHTMHHEFFHILTQTKNYSTDYQTLSAGHYHTSDWINVDDADAPKEGFVTGYASGEYNEDIAEMYSTYVTSSDEAWNKIMEASLIVTGETTKLDANGNPVYVLDENGDKIPIGYIYDQNGNRLVYQGDDGKFYYALEYQVEKVPTYDTTYYDILVQKLEMVRSYMNDSWGINLDELRQEVLRRMQDVTTLDLKNLK